jgi:hypothetical protein
MAELMKGHYFTAATLNRTHRWMTADCVFNYYVVFNFYIGLVRYGEGQGKCV